eukprot:TRINITY_DN7871_c0_g1_i2.p2 TRINITY_DN7871_c0_g1~~TRINITY_DN7871_c0_g1_i2.p2  ORF type:complete len:123 (-),score=19.77 TRINITY_DN7871_c0_g1_i2:24-392(-)
MKTKALRRSKDRKRQKKTEKDIYNDTCLMLMQLLLCFLLVCWGFDGDELLLDWLSVIRGIAHDFATRERSLQTLEIHADFEWQTRIVLGTLLEEALQMSPRDVETHGAVFVDRVVHRGGEDL